MASLDARWKACRDEYRGRVKLDGWQPYDAAGLPDVEWVTAMLRYRLWNGQQEHDLPAGTVVRMPDGRYLAFECVSLRGDMSVEVPGKDEADLSGNQLAVFRELHRQSTQYVTIDLLVSVHAFRRSMSVKSPDQVKTAVESDIHEVREKIGSRFIETGSPGSGKYRLISGWRVVTRPKKGNSITITERPSSRPAHPHDAGAARADDLIEEPEDRREFRWLRNRVKEHRGSIAWRAADFLLAEGTPVLKAIAPQLARRVPLLSRSGWILDEPVLLERVRVAPAQGESQMPVGPREELSRVDHANMLLPTNSRGAHHVYYTDAIQEFERPNPLRFENRASYRLLAVRGTEQEPQLEFGWGWYFEYLNKCELLVLDLARSFDWDGHQPRGLRRDATFPLRAEPFDLRRRCSVAGVDTLTLVKRQRGTMMVLMERKGSVATAHGVFHVMPAGEHQPPATPRPLSTDPDLDLWRTIVREYGEEFLGAEEIRDPAMWLDDEPYRSIVRARADEKVKPWYLGVGLDPLTFKAEILIACVWQEDTYEQIFGRLVPTPEGRSFEIAFDGQQVEFYTRLERTLPAGVACLLLAWAARRAIGAE